jgi:WD40 repeat protein
LTGSSDHTARLWSVRSVPRGKPVGGPLAHPTSVTAVAFAGDERHLATAQRRGLIRVWALPPDLSPMPAACGLAFAQVNRAIPMQPANAKPQAALLGNARDYRVPVGAQSFVRLSRDGRFLLPTGLSRSSCELRSTQVVDLATGEHLGALLPGIRNQESGVRNQGAAGLTPDPWPLTPGTQSGFIMDAAFSPDGLQVAVAVSRAASAQERLAKPGQPGQLLLWDWQAGKLQHEPLPLPSEPRGVDYSPDGRQLAVIGAKGEVVMIDPANPPMPPLAKGGSRGVRQWLANDADLSIGSYSNVGGIRFSPDNRSLLSFGAQNSVRVWDTLTGQLRHELPHEGRCHDAQFSPDGRLVATAGRDNWVCVWVLATGEQLARLEHPDWTYTAVFSPDGQHLLTACRDGMARLWDWRCEPSGVNRRVASGRLVCPPLEHEHEVHAVAFTPDGRHMLSASDDGVLNTWEWRTGKPVGPPLALGGAGLSLAVAPDGRRVVCGGFMKELPVFHLDWLTPAPLPPDDLCLWGEIVSGQRIEDGGGVTNLTAEEWLGRWRDFRRRYPGEEGPPSPLQRWR